MSPPVLNVTIVLIKSDVHGLISNIDDSMSIVRGRYTVSMSIVTTNGTNTRRKSWRDHSHTKQAVVICWISKIFDSRLFWIYLQSNSAPLAPIHKSRNLVNSTSAPAQPTPAVKIFAWPLPGILLRTKKIPTKSSKSIEYLENSCGSKKIIDDQYIRKLIHYCEEKNEHLIIMHGKLMY